MIDITALIETLFFLAVLGWIWEGYDRFQAWRKSKEANRSGLNDNKARLLGAEQVPFLRRILVALFGESKGYFVCPNHGYVFDPLVHGYFPRARR